MLVAVKQELPCITLQPTCKSQHLTAARGLAAAACKKYNLHSRRCGTWYLLHYCNSSPEGQHSSCIPPGSNARYPMVSCPTCLGGKRELSSQANCGLIKQLLGGSPLYIRPGTFTCSASLMSTGCAIVSCLLTASDGSSTCSSCSNVASGAVLLDGDTGEALCSPLQLLAVCFRVWH